MSQAMKFTVVHCCILFLSDGGGIAAWVKASNFAPLLRVPEIHPSPE
ncbi:hypothetical protein ACNKHR_12025 [Shigella flexneri]